MHGSGGFQALLHTYSLTAAILPGRSVFFLEAVCMEGVPPSLQTVGPLENGEVARPRLRELCAEREHPSADRTLRRRLHAPHPYGLLPEETGRHPAPPSSVSPETKGVGGTELPAISKTNKFKSTASASCPPQRESAENPSGFSTAPGKRAAHGKPCSASSRRSFEHGHDTTPG